MRRAALPLIALVAALLASCNALPSSVREERGIVTAVNGPNAAQVDSFAIRTGDGRELTFAVGQLRVGGEAFPAAHLQEHLISLTPVRVQYVEEADGRRVALRLTDAPAQ